MIIIVKTFEEIFKAHYPYVMQQIRKRVKNEQVAEDLAQEVFIQLYKSDWESIDYLKAWLAKSAIYVSYNYIRTEKRHEARIEKATTLFEDIDLQTLEDKWVRKEEIKQVRCAMNEMKEEDKKLLIMRYSGFKYKEIADLLEVDIACVGMMLIRAQKKFKKIYIDKVDVKT